MLESEREKVEEISKQKQMYKSLYQESQEKLEKEKMESEKQRIEIDALTKIISESD